jgi:hypothetical protein
VRRVGQELVLDPVERVGNDYTVARQSLSEAAAAKPSA